MKKTTAISCLIAVVLTSCSITKESVMPFINFKYSGERLFPVSENDADFTFRAWVSLSTSIDRVFTISYDRDLGYVGKLLEIRGHSLNQKIKDQTTFSEINITPKTGFERFIMQVDSLNLLEMKDQDANNFQSALHEPISMYVIEIKSHGKTNHFKFHTHITNNEKIQVQYQKIQQLILHELPFKFYVKEK